MVEGSGVSFGPDSWKQKIRRVASLRSSSATHNDGQFKVICKTVCWGPIKITRNFVSNNNKNHHLRPGSGALGTNGSTRIILSQKVRTGMAMSSRNYPLAGDKAHYRGPTGSETGWPHADGVKEKAKGNGITGRKESWVLPQSHQVLLQFIPTSVHQAV